MQDGGRGFDHRAQLFGGVVGAQFLEETQHDAKHDHDADHDRCADIAGEERDQPQHDQQNDQRVLDVLPQPGGQRALLLARHLVGAVAPPPILNLFAG